MDRFHFVAAAWPPGSQVAESTGKPFLCRVRGSGWPRLTGTLGSSRCLCG